MNQLQNITAYAGDIHEHLPTLSQLASQCSSVVEMGVRHCVSTWAFIDGLQHKGGKLTCIDIENPPEANLKAVEDKCKELKIDFEFVKASTLDVLIEETDMLFIDTLHTGEHLRKELKLHGNRARKWLVFHDTTSCQTELVPVIQEFINKNPHWTPLVVFYNCNGLTVLQRK